MLYNSVFADEDAQDEETRDASLFDTLRDLTEVEDGEIPADDARRHFVQSGMFSFTRPIISDQMQEGGDATSTPRLHCNFKKQRKPVFTTCGKCGASGRTIKNHGGATRETVNNPAKYKMQCQIMFGGCGHRFLLNRDPNADGSHTQVDSKFTIPGETKVRPDYKCGECGLIKVRGHKAVCTGKCPADAISDAGAVLERAKTLLGEGYGPDTAEADDDEGNAFPDLLFASIVASNQPAPVLTAPAVAPVAFTTVPASTAVPSTVAPTATVVAPTVAPTATVAPTVVPAATEVAPTATVVDSLKHGSVTALFEEM